MARNREPFLIVHILVEKSLRTTEYRFDPRCVGEDARGFIGRQD
jgi:hypothetical protein